MFRRDYDNKYDRVYRNRRLPVYQDSSVTPSSEIEGIRALGDTDNVPSGEEYTQTSKSRPAPPDLGKLAGRTFKHKSTPTKLYLEQTAKRYKRHAIPSSLHNPTLSKIYEESSFGPRGEIRGKGNASEVIIRKPANPTVVTTDLECDIPARNSDGVTVKLELPIPPKAPDGGFGWVVVMGSFFANFLVDGMCYTSGL